ncbi:hypothetical protein BN7_2728 [Wickerhamomyces ciferrii]|uniref:Uncharacterized protein n=1 Tax=Wickerhamomyces ciferrii (strain ATCC 14091 / BCRC 22168 / CBS 111 / JCM 3599 / NBRC 0793 / NRRL Y-1031 F-60-10) TaxID=1206466 RepID=K0KJP0_WICCF|nr:uncharacterized protein BN7_2728 [Wickerhamomyces ciferrii]CCH43181.1 hypothetical protein BN7_2728 [Wickerhamomyces ciferrii]
MLYELLESIFHINKNEKFMIYIRPAFIRYWRFKVSLLPLYHRFNQYWKPLNDNVLKKLKTKNEHEEESLLGPFPIEIWQIIMQKGHVRKEVLSINDMFFNELLPYAYANSGKTLQLLLVISSTSKMRQNDDCFLRNGPDFPSKPYESAQSIYERSLQSSKFEYEFLDVSYDVSTSFKYEFFGEQLYEDTLLITDYEEIKFIFSHIINNPDSRIKEHFKSIYVDVSILHGYQELIYDSDINDTLRKTGRSFPVDGSSVKIQVKANDFFYGTDSHQLFDKDNDRWSDPNGVLKNVDAHSFSLEPFKTANEIYPTKVYFNELIHIAELFKSYALNERKYLMNVSHKRQLRSYHPYNKYVLSHDQINRPLPSYNLNRFDHIRGAFNPLNLFANDLNWDTDDDDDDGEEEELEDDDDAQGLDTELDQAGTNFDGYELKSDGAIASHNVKIQKRRFATELETRSLIKKMIETLSSENVCNGVNTSLFIIGILSFEETTDIPKNETLSAKPIPNMFRYKPHMTLLNKPYSN